ncbi:MAG: amidohydrolase [Peptococcaceae bacterium]|jgi:imidazolonepropionase-like amidohydrolase|nr:amidohydrolase [Peptococcaceae bacterium]
MTVEKKMVYKAIVGATIWPGYGQVIYKGSLLWQNDKIVALGNQGEVELPQGTEYLNGAGLTVVPGLIDAHTHLGIQEEIYEYEGDDLNESGESAVTPEMRAIDGINPRDLAFKDALSGGVTTVMIAPGSANVIGGSICVLKTAGTNLERMVLDPEAGVKAAFGENPKRAYSELKKMPGSRMGIAALLRQALVDAQDYEKKKLKCEKEQEIHERDLGMELLTRLLRREIPLRAHAHRADDIGTAIRIGREFDLRLVLEHGTEADRMIPSLLEADIPVVLGPCFANRAKVEMERVDWRTAKDLVDAGVMIALTTDHSCTPIQYLSLCGAMAIRYGLSWRQALAAITINPARILGLENRIGSLAPGMDADFAIFDGDPFYYRAHCVGTFVNGQRVWTADSKKAKLLVWWAGDSQAGAVGDSSGENPTGGDLAGKDSTGEDPNGKDPNGGDRRREEGETDSGQAKSGEKLPWPRWLQSIRRN